MLKLLGFSWPSSHADRAEENFGCLWIERPPGLRLERLDGLRDEVPVLAGQRVQWQAQCEARALANDALDFHLAFVLSHDAFADRQAQPSTAGLGGEEWDEELARVTAFNATSLVIEDDLDAAWRGNVASPDPYFVLDARLASPERRDGTVALLACT